MRKDRTLGQLMALIDSINRIHHSAAQAYLVKEQAKGELKLEKQRLATTTELQKLDAETRLKEIEARNAAALRKEALLKDIALYVGLGVGAVAVLLTVGVLLVTSKRRKTNV